MEIEITFETKLFFDATVWYIWWCIRDTLSLCSSETLIIIVSFIKTKTTFDICREIAAMPVILITKPWKLFCQCHFWMNIVAGICVDVCLCVCVCLCNWQAFVVYPNDQDKMMLLNVFGGIGFGCAFIVHWCEQAITHAHTKALTSNLSPSNAFSMCFIIMPCRICSSLFQKWFKHDNMTPCLEINLLVWWHECKWGHAAIFWICYLHGRRQHDKIIRFCLKIELFICCDISI